MQYQRINITLPKDLANDLRKTIPARSRSKFISDLLAQKLKNKRNLEKELVKSLKANYELDKQIAKEFEPLDLETWPEW